MSARRVSIRGVGTLLLDDGPAVNLFRPLNNDLGAIGGVFVVGRSGSLSTDDPDKRREYNARRATTRAGRRQLVAAA